MHSWSLLSSTIIAVAHLEVAISEKLHWSNSSMVWDSAAIAKFLMLMVIHLIRQKHETQCFSQIKRKGPSPQGPQDSTSCILKLKWRLKVLLLYIEVQSCSIRATSLCLSDIIDSNLDIRSFYSLIIFFNRWFSYAIDDYSGSYKALSFFKYILLFQQAFLENRSPQRFLKFKE